MLMHDTLLVKMNSDLNKIQTWLKVNKLILNVKKIPKSRSKLDLLSDNFTVKVTNVHIERVTVYKSLGISIDENLSWNTHIDEISKRTSAGLSVFCSKACKSKHTIQYYRNHVQSSHRALF